MNEHFDFLNSNTETLHDMIRWIFDETEYEMTAQNRMIAVDSFLYANPHYWTNESRIEYREIFKIKAKSYFLRKIHHDNIGMINSLRDDEHRQVAELEFRHQAFTAQDYVNAV